MVQFTLENYPKSYGAIGLSDFRLEKFLDLSNRQLVYVEKNFWKFIENISLQIKPIDKYKNFQYLNSGWEWSVFLYSKFVYKIPAGIFPEINDPRYLKSSQISYNTIQKYIHFKFVAQTNFDRQNNQNIITQEYIQGKSNFKIGYHTQNRLLLNNLSELLESMLVMLSDQKWLPDFDIHRGPGGFVVKNIIIDKSNCPKIIDFTSYYDVYRLYPYRQQVEVRSKRRQIKDFLTWVNGPKV
jgi:hypothetical protein